MNKSLPLVTIAIPTYNRADGYLKQALKSAIDQTYQNIEIIISDNCSTDNTEMVVKSFDDPRILYFKQKENIGANNNFNFCLSQAKGEYFLLLQDDDLIDADFTDSCMRALKNNTEVGIIRTGVRTIDSCNKVLNEKQNIAKGLSTEDFFMAFLSHKVSMLLCGTLFNTRKLKEIGGFNSRYQRWQDVLAEFKLAAKYGRVDVQDIKASFRIHSSQLTFRSNMQEWCGDALLLLDTMCDLVSEKKILIRNRGMQYFAEHSYGIASKIKSPVKRFIANLVVFKKFKYRYIPPPVYQILRYIHLYYPLRFAKRKIKQIMGSLLP